MLRQYLVGVAATGCNIATIILASIACTEIAAHTPELIADASADVAEAGGLCNAAAVFR